MKKINKLPGLWMALALSLFLFSSCDEGEAPKPALKALFVVEAVEDEVNTWKLTNRSENDENRIWDKGDGSPLIEGHQSINVFYPNKGTYRVRLTITGPGGYQSTVQNIVVEEDAFPVEQLVSGGSMTSDESWTITSMGPTLTTTEFSEEGLKFSNGNNSQTNVAVWQAIEVKAGQKYKFSAQVKGSGAQNSWFEVFFGQSQPVSGSDYSDGVFVALNTWAGCGNSQFEGDIADLACTNAPGTGQGGIIEFDQDGIIYLVLKVGSWDGTLGSEGITIKDVSLITFYE